MRLREESVMKFNAQVKKENKDNGSDLGRNPVLFCSVHE